MTLTETPTGTVSGAPRMILQAEGAALFAAAIAGYAWAAGNWWVFALLLFVPDVFMLGYLADARRGAAIYNLGHTTVLPLLLIAAGWTLNAPLLVSGGLIWLAHVGFDRMVGYGLKYATGFRHTHLGG